MDARAFLAASAMMLVGQGGVAVLGYAFQAIMGRLLSPSDFATGQALVATVTVATVPAGPILLLFAKALTGHLDRGDDAAARRTLRRALFWAGGIGLACLAATLASLASLVQLLPGAGRPALVATAASILAGFLALVGIYALLGQRRLGAFNGVQLVAAALKVAASAGLVAAGFGIAGMVGGLFVATALYALFANLLAFGRPASGASAPTQASPPAPGREIAATVVANLGFALATQIDVVYVARELPEVAARGYAAVAAYAKLLFQLPGTVALVLFPLVSGERLDVAGAKTVLRRSLIFAAGLALVGLALYALAPGLLLRLAFGPRYLAAADLLFPCGLAAAPFGVVNVLLHYAVARGRQAVPWLIGALAMGGTMWLFVARPSVLDMLLAFGAGGAAIALAGALRYSR